MKRDPDDAHFINALRNFLGQDPIPELGKQHKNTKFKYTSWDGSEKTDWINRDAPAFLGVREKETQKCSNPNLLKQSKPQ